MSINSAQAKQIDIVAYLNKRGYKPSNHNNGYELYFKSPFRADEKKPSFAVNTQKNSWFDHGRGEGGNTLDLVIALENCSVRDALSHLSNYTNLSPLVPQNSAKNQTKLFASNTIQVEKVLPLAHHVLEKYLNEERNINVTIAKQYLKTIFYKNKNLTGLFALGFQNRKGHWELRSKYFKGCTGEKDLTVFRHSDNFNIFLFESWSDYLSLLSWRKRDHLDGITIILNGTALTNRAIEFIQTLTYKDVYTFFDNDEGGKTAFKKLQENLPNATFKQQNHFYKDYQDLNEWWAKQGS